MIKESFERVLREYDRKAALKSNPLAYFLVKEFPEDIRSSASITPLYLVDGTAGKGNWPEVPWIGIFDLQITKSAQRGYYIVYLFDAHLDGFHLSLNMGYTQFEQIFTKKKAREAMREKANSLKRLLHSAGDFNFTPISLKAKEDLGRGYEAGHICGKFYAKNYIPDDSFLINDLRNLIGVYRELKGIVGKDIVNFEADQEGKAQHIDAAFIAPTQKIVATELVLEQMPKLTPRKYNSTKPIIFKEEEALANQKRNRKIGEEAENLVFESERQRLIDLGKIDLAEKVKIVSADMSLGYDILSYEVDGKERYIEVKGTPAEYSTFFLSAHELEKSVSLDNYYLFVVHNVRTSKPRIQFVRQPKFQSDTFTIEPRQYIVKYHSKV